MTAHVSMETAIEMTPDAITPRVINYINQNDDLPDGGLSFLQNPAGSGSRRRLALVDVLRLRAIGFGREINLTYELLLPAVSDLTVEDLLTVVDVPTPGRCFVRIDCRLSVEDPSDLIRWCLSDVVQPIPAASQA